MKNLKRDFTSGNASKLLLGLVVPIFMSFLLTIAYNIIDTLWVGNLMGEEAVAALTVSYPIVLLLTSVAMGGSNGTSILISKFFGAKDKEGKNKSISTAVILSVFSSIIISVLCIILVNPILNLLNTPADIFDGSKSYLVIYLCGFIFVNIFLYLSAIARSLGNSVVQMEFLAISSVLNIILDPIFIKLIGIKGAAFATVLSEGIMVVCMIVYFKKHKFIKVRLKDFDTSICKLLLQKSIPSIIQQCIPAVSTSFVTSIVGGFGVSVIAGFGICGKVEGILLYPAMALNMALTVAAGQCVGAKKVGKAKEYLRFGLLYGIVSTFVLALIVTLCSGYISNAFVRSDEVITIVRSYFLIIFIGYVCNAISNCILGIINGSGNPAVVMYFMIFYYCIVRMPLAKILANTSLKTNGIWIAVLISHLAAMVTILIYYKLVLTKKIKEEMKLGVA